MMLVDVALGERSSESRTPSTFRRACSQLGVRLHCIPSKLRRLMDASGHFVPGSIFRAQPLFRWPAPPSSAGMEFARIALRAAATPESISHPSTARPHWL